MTAPIRVTALCGSLRKASYNAAALRVAIDVAPQGMTITPAEIGDLPLYNDDIKQQGFPAPVQRLGKAILEADALLIVTPEYNFSIPGVLKNAIDWVSRMQPQPFDGKPVAIMGAAMGPLGTGRAQYDLRKMLVYLNAHTVNKPEVFIGMAQNKFDAEGKLTDETTRGFIKQLTEALAAWTIKLRG
jgi:chromate reductase